MQSACRQPPLASFGLAPSIVPDRIDLALRNVIWELSHARHKRQVSNCFPSQRSEQHALDHLVERRHELDHACSWLWRHLGRQRAGYCGSAGRRFQWMKMTPADPDNSADSARDFLRPGRTSRMSARVQSPPRIRLRGYIFFFARGSRLRPLAARASRYSA